MDGRFASCRPGRSQGGPESASSILRSNATYPEQFLILAYFWLTARGQIGKMRVLEGASKEEDDTSNYRSHGGRLHPNCARVYAPAEYLRRRAPC